MANCFYSDIQFVRENDIEPIHYFMWMLFGGTIYCFERRLYLFCSTNSILWARYIASSWPPLKKKKKDHVMHRSLYKHSKKNNSNLDGLLTKVKIRINDDLWFVIWVWTWEELDKSQYLRPYKLVYNSISHPLSLSQATNAKLHWAKYCCLDPDTTCLIGDINNGTCPQAHSLSVFAKPFSSHRLTKLDQEAGHAALLLCAGDNHLRTNLLDN